MSEPLELSGMIPYLVLIWFVTLLFTLGSLALDDFRGTLPRRPMLTAIGEWIGAASAMSIGVVFTELYSHQLISLASHVFIIVMLFALLVVPRMASSLTGPGPDTADDPPKRADS